MHKCTGTPEFIYIVEVYCYLITICDGTNNLELCWREVFKYIYTKKFQTKNFGHRIGQKKSMPQNA